MLFPQRFWSGLADGSITLAFRRWKGPRAAVGGRHRTPAGVLAIDAVDLVERDDITNEDARRAGFADRVALLAELDRRGDGPAYRIRFHHAGTDPRIELRQQDEMTDDEFAAVVGRLGRLDRASAHGAWTATVLRLIAARPAVRAADLAAELQRDKPSFKVDVRKLKELGLTESLEIGYRLSPRGRAVLDHLEAGGG